MAKTRSAELFERARQTIAGGVNSSTRGLNIGWRPYPPFIHHGDGSHLFDVDENEYIDYILGHGPAILGHRPAAVTRAVSDAIQQYGALFALVGAGIRRPLVAGLVFAFGWEPGVLLIPGYLKHFTVAYYLQALVPHAMPSDSAVVALLQAFQESASVPVSLGCLTAITLLSLWFAGRVVERREYVLEQ